MIVDLKKKNQEWQCFEAKCGALPTPPCNPLM